MYKSAGNSPLSRWIRLNVLLEDSSTLSDSLNLRSCFNRPSLCLG